MKSLEDRLYECFESVFDKYNGKLIVPLNKSDIVGELVGENCDKEFCQEMYERYLKTHKDINVEK